MIKTLFLSTNNDVKHIVIYRMGIKYQYLWIRPFLMRVIVDEVVFKKLVFWETYDGEF